jgi:hypothetical protein
MHACLYLVYLRTYVSVYMTSLSIVCMGSHIMSYARAFSHTHAFSLDGTSIGDEGAQHIAGALVHNSTLQTLK